MESRTLISQYQIEPYRGGPEKLNHSAISFVGSPRNSIHPGKILLQNDPVSQQSFFYEFRTADILYAEELSSLSMPDGSAASMVKLWVKKGATALKIEPFHVQDTAGGLRDFFQE